MRGGDCGAGTAALGARILRLAGGGACAYEGPGRRPGEARARANLPASHLHPSLLSTPEPRALTRTRSPPRAQAFAIWAGLGAPEEDGEEGAEGVAAGVPVAEMARAVYEELERRPE